MKKITVRCWKDEALCANGDRQPVFFSVPDFGDAPELFICPSCGALFAIDQDELFYKKINFADERNKLHCPECNASLGQLLPYPDYFICQGSRAIENYHRFSRNIPDAKDSLAMEFWNPLTEAAQGKTD